MENFHWKYQNCNHVKNADWSKNYKLDESEINKQENILKYIYFLFQSKFPLNTLHKRNDKKLNMKQAVIEDAKTDLMPLI